ncbi:putative integral membrane protein [Histomonas meleagridis]|uniref:putative integral membrane protein n=1 Tax=Histomonas meleagridis TaxID=135588 RepID=UPI00355A3541|nr:putative integral membrane protein [Histomonas meleagridis]KAH0796589.1 putative integral membrane protein [Histomonas meleagridis]
MAQEVSFTKKFIIIGGMLLFGTCTVVIQKFLFEQEAIGDAKYGGEPRKFKKPWFQTASMFVGMFSALVVYEVQRCIQKRKGTDQSLQSVDAEETEKAEKTTHKKFYFIVAIPACFDLLATSLMNIGLLYIQASVWQMLRGSMVLFSSIFCAFILKRPHYPFMWWSVLLIIIALTIVGVAAVSSTGVGKAGVTTGQVILAIGLTVGSQLIQASQIVVEDFLMHDLTASPVLIVGLEGMWGTIITGCIFLPIISVTGGIKDEGNGVHEDTIDSFKMIGNSPVLIVFVILYILVILFYNVTGMYVTNITSAVIRTILEGLRTLCIWVVEIIMFYSTGNPDLGEEWTVFSFMQLAGFFLLFTGMLLYNKIIRIPIFNYPDEEKQEKVVDDTPLIQKDD